MSCSARSTGFELRHRALARSLFPSSTIPNRIVVRRSQAFATHLFSLSRIRTRKRVPCEAFGRPNRHSKNTRNSRAAAQNVFRRSPTRNKLSRFSSRINAHPSRCTFWCIASGASAARQRSPTGRRCGFGRQLWMAAVPISQTDGCCGSLMLLLDGANAHSNSIRNRRLERRFFRAGTTRKNAPR